MHLMLVFAVVTICLGIQKTLQNLSFFKFMNSETKKYPAILQLLGHTLHSNPVVYAGHFRSFKT